MYLVPLRNFNNELYEYYLKQYVLTEKRRRKKMSFTQMMKQKADDAKRQADDAEPDVKNDTPKIKSLKISLEI